MLCNRKRINTDFINPICVALGAKPNDLFESQKEGERPWKS